MWFSVVCTLVDNDMRHYSGQNAVGKSNDAYSLSIRVQTTLNHIRFVFYLNINVKENIFSERELEKVLRDTLTRAALS